MTTVLAMTLAYAGLAALCLAMDRHHAQVFGRVPATRAVLALRVLGVVLLASSALPSLGVFGAANGVVAWFGLLTGAALLLVFTLPFAPRAAAAFAVLGPAVAALFTALHG